MDHIGNIRTDAKRLVADWFSKNIPGLCSAGLLGGEFPTCEFVTLRKAQPFPTKEEYDGEFQWYMHDLGLNHSFGSWECEREPSLRFCPSSEIRNAGNYHSILSINEHSWNQCETQANDRSAKETKIHDMHRKMSGILGMWAVGVLLEGYARHFSALRNSGILRATHRQSAVQALKQVFENVSYSIDIAAVTDELNSLVRMQRPLSFEVERFVPRPDAPDYMRKESLEQLIYRQIGKNADWLQTLDIAVREQLTQYGTILGAVENLHLQKSISRFSCAILALTIVLAVLTLVIGLGTF